MSSPSAEIKTRGVGSIATGRAAPQLECRFALGNETLITLMRRNRVSGIEVYTGGKSTSALGKALQAIGRSSQDQSHRVLIMQLRVALVIQKMQQSPPTANCPNLVDHQRCGRDAIVASARAGLCGSRGWEIARAAIASGLYKTIILDELNHG